MRTRPRNTTPVLAKYLLLEFPGWLLAAGVLGVLVRVWDLSVRTAVLVFALWVIKDLVLFPWLRTAYTDGSPDATEALVGATATVRETLDPTGYVRLGAELWRAEVAREHAPLAAGSRVRVRAVRGLTLHVEPE
ncbi:MAG: NfeD family protein [Myxococcales bacterium]|nr:NfeD family protein [Myxococcales bacterium]MDH5305586.1 NfeD family protein [Myxococcales bacterium]MDH5567487.1 NfeD family protein [Myxococcales bacterium]